MSYRILVFTLLVILTGCMSSTLPKPNVEGPIHTLGGGFMVESGKLKYGLTYKSKSIVEPIYAKAEFENPNSGNPPLVSDIGKLNINENIVVQSPAFDGIRNNTNYTAVLYLYADEAKTKLVHKHVDQVRFSMPAELISLVGIKEL